MRPKKTKTTEKIYDRKSTDLLISAQVSPIVVKDPAGDNIEVLRSHRDDYLAYAHAHNDIDDAQYKAGRKWQRLQELCAVGSVQAIDPTKEAVDGGRFSEPIGDHQMAAAQEISEAQEQLYDSDVFI